MLVDMHCHILPGLDDGSETMEESMASLRAARLQGFSGMIVTPHYHPGRYMADGQAVLEALERLRQRADQERLAMRLYPGQECYYHAGLAEALETGRALTLCGTRFVLVEFEPSVQFSEMKRALRALSGDGYRPVLAHFERCHCLRGHPERLSDIREVGAMLQMNFDCLSQRGSLLRRNPWRNLVKAGYVDFLGSDTHGMRFRPMQVQAALSWLRQGIPPEMFRRITEDNIRLLIQGSE